MRITYLKLENFSNIYVALSKKVIEISLKDSHNRVVLLIGPNGSGKTSILSQLHPFSHPGNMDVRHGSTMILENQNGYKEIHYENNNDIYIIKHHYINKANKMIKSYIMKNGEELNPNGNVTSFKEIVELELGIEQNMLKLCRLGSNVSTFINMKSTERKSFTSNILSDVDMYSVFYKNINERLKSLRSILNNTVDKIKKLNISEIDDIYEERKNLENEIMTLSKEIDNNKIDIGIYKSEIQKSVSDYEKLPYIIKSLKEELSDLKNNKKKLLKSIMKLPILVGYIDKEIENQTKLVIDLEKSLLVLDTKISNKLDRRAILHKEKLMRDEDLKFIKNDNNIKETEELIKQLEEKKNLYAPKFSNFKPKCSKDEVLDILGLCQKIDSMIKDILANNDNAIMKAIELFSSKKDINSFCNKKMKYINSRLENYRLQILRMKDKDTSLPFRVILPPDECESSQKCNFVKFYMDIFSNKKSPVENIEKEIKLLESEKEYIESIQNVYGILNTIQTITNINKSLVSKIPWNVFDMKNIIRNIVELIPYYEEKQLTALISLIEEYNEYKETDSKIDELKKELEFTKKNDQGAKILTESLEKIYKELDQIEKSLEELNNEKDSIIKNIDKNKIKLENLNQLQDLSNQLIELEKEIAYKKETLEEKESTLDSVKITIDKIDILEERLNSREKTMSLLRDKLNNINYKIKDFNTLTEERKILEEDYDETFIIKESVSSNKGIPLLFMNLYFKNARKSVNDLLDIVYKGDLRIEKFLIDEKEFKIPYNKRGVVIDDIVYASQGETSFLSLTLSFAIIKQSLKNYNIMLLDEIDATLDQTNRGLFLSILEKQLESINAEQVFMITHNNMFDDYPVDIIMTSDVPIDNYKNLNIIYKG